MGRKFLTTPTLPTLPSPPSSPSVGDMYFDTTLGKIGVYTASGWVYNLHQIEDGSITTSKIADGAVTPSKLAPGAVIGNLGYTPVNRAGDTMTGPLNVSGNVRGVQFISTATTGTAPLQVSSTTLVSNLNADLLDGYDSTDFPRKSENATITATWTFNANINIRQGRTITYNSYHRVIYPRWGFSSNIGNSSGKWQRIGTFTFSSNSRKCHIHAIIWGGRDEDDPYATQHLVMALDTGSSTSINTTDYILGLYLEHAPISGTPNYVIRDARIVIPDPTNAPNVAELWIQWHVNRATVSPEVRIIAPSGVTVNIATDRADDANTAPTSPPSTGIVLSPNHTRILEVANRLATARTITLGGSLSGSTTFDGSSNVTINASINAGAVGATQIADNAVTTNKIAEFAVTNSKIAEFAVTNSKIAEFAVTNSKIADYSIDRWKIADGAVATSKIDIRAVTTDRIADLAITTDKVADFAIDRLKIADGAVNTSKIEDYAITTSKIADLAITTDKVADFAIDRWKIADGAVATSKIEDYAITNSKIADLAVTTSKIADESVTYAKLAQDVKDAIENSGGGGGARIFQTTIGNGTDSTYTITHNFDTTNIEVSLILLSTTEKVGAKVEVLNNNQIQVSFISPIALNSVKVVVIG